MNRLNKTWTAKEIKAAKTMQANGVPNDTIADVLGRSEKAVVMRMFRLNNQAPQQTLKFTKQNKPVEAKYTRYLEPKRTVSILWGLIKYTR
jgi:hypothetical protein